MSEKFLRIYSKQNIPAIFVAKAGLISAALAMYNLYGFKNVDDTVTVYNAKYQASNYSIMVLGLSTCMFGVYMVLKR